MENNLNKLARVVHDKGVFGADVVDKDGNVVKQFRPEKGKNILTISESDLGVTGAPTTPDVPDVTTGGDTGGESTAKPYQGVDFDCPLEKVFNPLWFWGTGTNFDIYNTNHLKNTSGISRDSVMFLIDLNRSKVENGHVTETKTIPIVTNQKATEYITDTYIAAAPVPIAIKKADLKDGQSVKVELGGLGEKVDKGTHVQSPVLEIQYSSGSTELVVTQWPGFKLTEDDLTGYRYDVNLRFVDQFDYDKKDDLVPAGATLFQGSSTGGNIPLSTKVNATTMNLKNGVIIDGNNEFSHSGSGASSASGSDQYYVYDANHSSDLTYISGNYNASVNNATSGKIMEGVSNIRLTKLDLINEAIVPNEYINSNKEVYAIKDKALAQGATLNGDSSIGWFPSSNRNGSISVKTSSNQTNFVYSPIVLRYGTNGAYPSCLYSILHSIITY